MKKPSRPKSPPALLPALLKNLAEQAAGARALPPDTYTVRGAATFAVDCMVTQAAPTTARAVVKVDQARLVAAFLELLGVRQPKPDRLHEMVALAFRRATEEPSEEAFRAFAAQIEDTLRRCREEAAEALPRVERAGVCRAPGTVELVGWQE